jgi:hypothetical protein
MTTIKFYKKLSHLLTDVREQFLTLEESRDKFEDLKSIAKKNNITLIVDESIFEWYNLTKLDDGDFSSYFEDYRSNTDL